jgi:hypothetical protein
MSYRTVEVEIEKGRIRTSGEESLPEKGRGLLTLLTTNNAARARTCADLAKWWTNRERLPKEEAMAFAEEIEKARAELPPPKPAWD